MNLLPSSRPRSLWVPVLVVALGWVFSAGTWAFLLAERRAQLVSTARELSRDSQSALRERLRSQQAELEALAELSALVGARQPPEWRAVVELLLEARALDRVSWLDLDSPSGGLVVGRPAAPGELAARLAAEGELGAGARVIGPLRRDEDEGYAYRFALPVRAPDDHPVVLVAHVLLTDLLTPLLQARAPGYAIRVAWDDQVVYQRGRASEDPALDWWLAETSVALPGGGTWRVSHRPTDDLAALRLTPVPHYLLAAGLALSVLLGALVHQWRLASGHARALAESNEILELRHRDLEHLNDELERRVSDRTEQLEDAVAELESFNYSVSHDLRSPLGAVLNLAAILEEDYRDRLDDEGRELVARIQRCASRATGLLEDLLALSQAGQAVLELEPIETTAFAREMFAQARASEEDGGEIELNLGPLPPVRADRALLGTVFTNLFSNALKYSRGREKRCVSVTGRVEPNEYVIEVADNGRGFDMRFAQKLFGLFERLHGNDEIEGTGVGLAMVARIVKRHGGRVWAHGTPDVGARFSFALPRIGAGQ